MCVGVVVDRVVFVVVRVVGVVDNTLVSTSQMAITIQESRIKWLRNSAQQNEMECSGMIKNDYAGL